MKFGARFRMPVLLLLGLLLPGSPVWAPTAFCNALILSNEAPGSLITKLIRAGHGSDSIYQVTEFLASLPQIGAAIYPGFLDNLKQCPSSSEIHTIPLARYSGTQGALAITDFCKVVVSSIGSVPYVGRNGTLTIATRDSTVQDVSIVYALDFIPANSQGLPFAVNGLSRFSAGGGPIGLICEVFAIVWSGPGAAAGVPTLSNWGTLVLAVLLLATAGIAQQRRTLSHRPKKFRNDGILR